MLVVTIHGPAPFVTTNVAKPPETYAPLPMIGIEKCVASTTVIVNIPLAAVFPVTPVMFTWLLFEKAYTALVWMTTGLAFVAPTDCPSHGDTSDPTASVPNPI